VNAATGETPRPHWWGTLLYLPVLYGFGWLASRPLALLAPGWRSDQVNLAGLAISLLLLLATLPLRLRRVWHEFKPWRRLGLTLGGGWALAQGVLIAALLLTLVTGGLLLSGQARWLGELNAGLLLNGLALLLGVGFAEELLFRGWLWGELELLVGRRRALPLQALLFALVHPWHRSGAASGLALLGGLTLLGVALALLRRRLAGSLWAPIGLHGGLVGGWLVLQHGLIGISATAPSWLVGPGQGDVNPLGGLLGWLGLAGLLLWLRCGGSNAVRGEETQQ
jgi:membrane protease YdiL (CAAX protease family)